ncbi:MFS transporter [Actinomycetospora sp. NBRC 106378]|uniref:MFS transporter n=1 Tax=Actinomycetospora sp. NBRC 106378 TaxID=3032208 RepID=UPI0024A13E28|nr:MFS transporter [Actinomycetospora sp. NBRC 106378]GLZ53299.1 MFS transporter [Actinomycetospora sp. NBRC 106378]
MSHDAPASPFRQPKAVWAVAFACVISFMGIGLVDPILPALAQQLAATPAQVSLLFTSYLLITAVAMLVTGWVSSRIGAKATLVIGLAIIVVFAALAGLSGSIGEIVGFRAGWGLGNALFIATSLAVIVASASGGFAGAIILYETALGVGIALGPLVGGLLGSVSWRAPFFGVAVLMAIALVATLVLLDRTPRPTEKISLGAPLAALRHRSLATIALTAFAYNWGFFTLLAYSPYSMGDLGPLGLGGVFTAWGVLVAVFAVFAAPALERRFGTVRVLYVVLGLLALDLLVIAIGQDTPGVVIGAVIVAGAMIGLNNTLVTQAVMSVAPVPRPVASASYSFVRFLGGGLAPFVSGLLAEAFLPNTPFWVAAVVVAIGVLVLATAHRLLRAAETSSEEGGVPDGRSVPVAVARPVLVALDDAPHADTVLTTGARLARTVDAPLLLVHVAEDAVIGDAVGSDAAVLDHAAGVVGGDLRVVAESLAPVATHDAVGPALAELATARDARAIVVGSPHGGPLAALARPSADRALFAHADRPIIVVPAGMAPPAAVSGGPRQAPDVSDAPRPDVEALLTGRVHDGGGRPVEAVLTLVDGAGHRIARGETDSDGGFGLPNPGHGTGLLVVRARGGGAPAVVAVGLGAPTSHDVVVEGVFAVGGAV